MKKPCLLGLSSLLLLGLSVSGVNAADGSKEVKEAKKLPTICVLDFTSPDISGNARFLNSERKPVTIMSDCTLTDSDRISMNSVMQGYVSMIDARDASKTNDVAREAYAIDYVYDREKELALYETVVKGEQRPILLGADYLTGYLGRHPDVVNCLPAETGLEAMKVLSKDPSFPQDFMKRLSVMTGATHIMYGSVSDVRQTLKAYHGYGIETNSILYELDVTIKLVDLPAQRTVYSGVYTGSLREGNMLTGGITIDGSKYQTLMKSAMEQAADDVVGRFRKGELAVTPIPDASILPAPAEKKAEKPADVKAEASPAPAAKIPTPREKGETVIIRQGSNVVVDQDGIPAIPEAPVPVPAAGNGATVIITEPAARNTNVNVVR